jgi:mannitol-1-/sugar-/sorbitol-6-phosphatase
MSPLVLTLRHGAALLFDADGVLVDSDGSVRSAWTKWASEYHLDPDTVFDMVHGRRAAETVALLVSEEQREEAVASIDRYELEDAASVPAIPGATPLLRALPHGRWAVVTSATRSLGTARLRAAQLEMPDVLVSGDDVNQGKPAPDGYLLGATLLRANIEECIVIEDAASGIAAARAAGVAMVIGVGNRAGVETADVVIDDLSALEWNQTEQALVVRRSSEG